MKPYILGAGLLLAACASPAEPALRQATEDCNLGDRLACSRQTVLQSTVALDHAESTMNLLGFAAIGFGAYAATLPGHFVPLYPSYPWWWWY